MTYAILVTEVSDGIAVVPVTAPSGIQSLTIGRNVTELRLDAAPSPTPDGREPPCEPCVRTS